MEPRSLPVLVGGEVVIVTAHPCAHCGGPFDHAVTHGGTRRRAGRARVYCSPRCRRAHAALRREQGLEHVPLGQLALQIDAAA